MDHPSSRDITPETTRLPIEDKVLYNFHVIDSHNQADGEWLLHHRLDQYELRLRELEREVHILSRGAERAKATCDFSTLRLRDGEKIIVLEGRGKMLPRVEYAICQKCITYVLVQGFADGYYYYGEH